jgi:hypothetical protein
MEDIECVIGVCGDYTGCGNGDNSKSAFSCMTWRGVQVDGGGLADNEYRRICTIMMIVSSRAGNWIRRGCCVRLVGVLWLYLRGC